MLMTCKLPTCIGTQGRSNPVSFFFSHLVSVNKNKMYMYTTRPDSHAFRN